MDESINLWQWWIKSKTLKNTACVSKCENSREDWSTMYTSHSYVWQSVNSGGAAVRTPKALQGELCLQQAKWTMGKLTYRLITVNELEQCCSSCLPWPANLTHTSTHTSTHTMWIYSILFYSILFYSTLFSNLHISVCPGIFFLLKHSVMSSAS